jgi:hypothetical protein
LHTLALPQVGRAAKRNRAGDGFKLTHYPAAYTEARAGIDSADAFVRSLDEVRSKAGVSKALLAKRTGTQPAAMRRLLTMATAC